MGFRGIIDSFYGPNYKKLLILPAILFFLLLIAVFVYPGVPAGIDIKGGTLIIMRTPTAPPQFDAKIFEQAIAQEFGLEDVAVTTTMGPSGFGIIVEYSASSTLESAKLKLEEAKSLLESNPARASASAREAIMLLSDYVSFEEFPSDPTQAVDFADQKYSAAIEVFDSRFQQRIKDSLGVTGEAAFQKREIGPIVGKLFWDNAMFVSMIAIILVTIVIFVFFREIIPSVAVILAAVFDVLFALAGMAIFGIPLSLASIPSLLLLIGYSIDTDIMLTTKVLKRRDADLYTRANASMVTGLTMTGTTLAAVTLMAILSYFGGIFVLFEIASVLLFGLIGDLVSTWFMNAPILLWYSERKKKGVK